MPCVIFTGKRFNEIAFLNSNSVNVTVGEKEERMMMTGMHTVVDIFCVACGSLVGWKYVRWLAHLFSVAAVSLSICSLSRLNENKFQNIQKIYRLEFIISNQKTHLDNLSRKISLSCHFD